MPMLFTVIL